MQICAYRLLRNEICLTVFFPFWVGYQSVLEKERKGDYLGKTVQVIMLSSDIIYGASLKRNLYTQRNFSLSLYVQVVPHITDAIKDWIESVSLTPVDGKDGPADVCVIELGGTVGKCFQNTGASNLLKALAFLPFWCI